MSSITNFSTSDTIGLGFSHLDSSGGTSLEKPLKDPVKHTCTDVARQVFSFLSATDLESCGLVNKEWQKTTAFEALRKKVFLNTFVFGKEKWNTYFGDVGAEPPLPENIEEILRSQCPYFPDKRVFQTHTLVLIPKTIDGKPYNLNSLVELVKKPSKTGQKTGFKFFLDDILKKHGDTTVKESHWVLMTKDIIPGSRTKFYPEQLELIAHDLNYRAPTLLEAATCIIAEHLKTGVRLFRAEEDLPQTEWTYTRCQESIRGWFTIMGGFLPSGLYINWCSDFRLIGIAALRKL